MRTSGVRKLIGIAASLAFAHGIAYAGGVSGKAAFEGASPEAKPINFGAEKQCAAMHGDKMPTNEDILVNANGTLKNVLVYVKEGASPAASPAEAAMVDQVGCVFVPHVAVVRAGQKVTFRNSDDVLHNVRTVAKVNKAFNIAQPVKGMQTLKTFERPEVGIQLRCDVHFWMVSYLHVLDHPYYAVTSEEGSFEIKDLPPGRYVIEAWHEKLGAQTAEVEIGEGETKTADFSFKQA